MGLSAQEELLICRVKDLLHQINHFLDVTLSKDSLSKRSNSEKNALKKQVKNIKKQHPQLQSVADYAEEDVYGSSDELDQPKVEPAKPIRYVRPLPPVNITLEQKSGLTKRKCFGSMPILDQYSDDEGVDHDLLTVESEQMDGDTDNPYTDTSMTYSRLNDAEIQGFLLKKRRNKGLNSLLGTQKRWCALSNGMLCYCPKPVDDSPVKALVLDGYIAQKDFSTEAKSLKANQYPFFLVATGKPTFDFIASTDIDRMRWIHGINRMANTSNSAQAEEEPDYEENTLSPDTNMLLRPALCLPSHDVSDHDVIIQDNQPGIQDYFEAAASDALYEETEAEAIYEETDENLEDVYDDAQDGEIDSMYDDCEHVQEQLQELLKKKTQPDIVRPASVGSIYDEGVVIPQSKHQAKVMAATDNGGYADRDWVVSEERKREVHTASPGHGQLKQEEDESPQGTLASQLQAIKLKKSPRPQVLPERLQDLPVKPSVMPQKPHGLPTKPPFGLPKKPLPTKPLPNQPCSTPSKPWDTSTKLADIPRKPHDIPSKPFGLPSKPHKLTPIITDTYDIGAVPLERAPPIPTIPHTKPVPKAPVREDLPAKSPNREKPANATRTDAPPSIPGRGQFHDTFIGNRDGRSDHQPQLPPTRPNPKPKTIGQKPVTKGIATSLEEAMKKRRQQMESDYS